MGLFRATFSGTLGSAEVFAFSWAFRVDESDDTAAQLPGLTTWLTTFLDTTVATSNSRVKFPTTVVWNKIRCARYLAGAVVESTDTGITQAGSSSSPMLPYEVSCAVSLKHSGAARPNRGRFYLPPFHTGLMDGQTGVYAASGGIDVIVGGLEAAFNAFVVPGKAVGIMRNTLLPTPVTTVADASHFNVGNVPDAQRRRRNKQVEVRQTRAIT